MTDSAEHSFQTQSVSFPVSYLFSFFSPCVSHSPVLKLVLKYLVLRIRVVRPTHITELFKAHGMKIPVAYPLAAVLVPMTNCCVDVRLCPSVDVIAAIKTGCACCAHLCLLRRCFPSVH